MADEIVRLIIQATENVTKILGNVDKGLNKLSSSAGNVAQSFAPVSLAAAAALGGGIKLAADWQKSLDGAARSLDLSGEKLEKFGKQAEDLQKKLNFQKSSTEIANLAADIGKLGVAEKDIFNLTETVIKVATATDKLGKADEIAVNLAKISQNFKMSASQVKEFGAALNAVDDAGSVTADELANFTQRVSQFFPVMKLSQQQALAWGSTLVGTGMDVSSAASFMKNFTNRLAAVNTLSEPASVALEKMGYNLKNLQQDFLKKPNETMIKFIQNLNKLPEAQKFDTIVQVFGQEWSAAMLNVANNTDLLNKQLKIAGDSSANLKKLDNEFSGMSQSFEGMLRSFQNQVAEIGKQLGMVLLPAINSLLKDLSPLLQKVLEFTQTNPEVTKWIVGFLGITALIAPIAGLVSAITALIPLITGIGAAVTAVAAIVGAPIALIVAGIAAIAGGAYLIISNWSSISEFFTKLWASVVYEFYRFKNWLGIESGKAVAQFLKPWQLLGNNITLSLDGVGKSIINFINWVHGLGKYIQDSAYNWGRGLLSGFINGLQSMYGTVQNVMNNFTNWLRQYLPSSDAKLGGLSDLTYSGKMFAKTFLSGIEQSGLGNSLGGILQTPNTSGIRPAFSSPASNSSNTIDFNPTYNITARDSDDIIKQLKERDRQLLDLINRSTSRETRRAY